MAGRDDLRASLGQAHVRPPLHRARRRRSTPVRDRARAREPDRAAHRHAAARRPRRDRARRGRAGRRRPAGHRRPGHPVPGHHDVRRPGRPAGPAPARPAGRASARCCGCAACWAPSASPSAATRFPTGSLDVHFRDLHFAYAEGRFALAARRPAGARRPHLCPGRPHRLRQVDAGLAAVPGRRARARLGAARRRRRPGRRPAAAALRGRRGHPAHRDPGRDAGREHHALRARPARRRRAGGRGARPRGPGWPGFPRGSTPSLGPGGTTLSAGEEQLVAFARLLVRDVRVVVLDEATARMDPVTEAHVVRAADRLLAGRTGLLVAHRLSTTERAEQVAVLDGGRVVQHGPRERAGRAARTVPLPARGVGRGRAPRPTPSRAPARPASAPPGAPVSRLPRRELRDRPGLARATLSALLIEPRWGLVGIGLFLARRSPGPSVRSPAGSGVTSWSPSRTASSPVAAHRRARGRRCSSRPLLLAEAFRRYPRWWISVMLRVRSAVLAGQTAQHRLRADAARRGRRPHHGRRPAGPVRRPLGRLRSTASPSSR